MQLLIIQQNRWMLNYPRIHLVYPIVARASKVHEFEVDTIYDSNFAANTLSFDNNTRVRKKYAWISNIINHMDEWQTNNQKNPKKNPKKYTFFFLFCCNLMCKCTFCTCCIVQNAWIHLTSFPPKFGFNIPSGSGHFQSLKKIPKTPKNRFFLHCSAMPHVSETKMCAKCSENSGEFFPKKKSGKCAALLSKSENRLN